MLELQAWLTCRGVPLIPDGDFGPLTEGAVNRFRADRQLPASDTPVDAGLWNELING